MLSFLFALSCAFASRPVVTVGGSFVAGAPPSDPAAAAWVPVLADCLEEGKPGRFPVVDRSRVALRPDSVAADVEALRALSPIAVVLGFGSEELPKVDPTRFRERVREVVKRLRADGGPQVYLLGLVAPLIGQTPNPRRTQPEVDAAIRPFNDVLASMAAGDDGVWYVDLWASWPRSQEERARLTEGGYRLTDPAHARVGAVICEQLLTHLETPRP